MSQSTGEQAGMRYLHTMLRVRHLEKSIDFYSRYFGMSLLRRQDYPEGQFTLAFLGYGDEDTHTVLELTHNWDQVDAYDLGNGYGHIAIGVPDIHGICEKMSGDGVKVVRPPGPMKHGKTVIAFIEDPDGYKVELIEY